MISRKFISIIAILTFLLINLMTNTAFPFRYIEERDMVPSLTLEDLSSQKVELQFKDKISVIVFWRVKQEQNFSIKALIDLERIYQDLKGKGVEVYAISEKVAKLEEVKNIVANHHFSFPFFLDKHGQAEEEFGIIVFPSTGIIDKEGYLRLYRPTRNPQYQESIRKELELLLGMKTETQVGKKIETFEDSKEKAQEYYNRAFVLSGEGKNEEAIRELRQALGLYPNYLDAHVELGYALLEKGDVDQAMKEFQYVLNVSPTSPGARTGIGIVYVRKGNLEKGIEFLKEAVTVNPNPVRGYYELGRAYEKKGEIDKAVHHYKWALKKLLQGRR